MSADLFSLPTSWRLAGGFLADGLRAQGQRLCSILSSGFKARLQVCWEPCPSLLSVTTLGSETVSAWPHLSPGAAWSPPTLQCPWASLFFSFESSLSFPLQFVAVVHLLIRVRLCDHMDCSTLGFPVLHHLPELAQTPVH